jgi:ankyrin repeat protein
MKVIVSTVLVCFFVQVNMPVDSFESPLTLAACGGHYELAALLISRGADLEEVNDEG